MIKQVQDINAYIRIYAEDVQILLRSMRKTIRAAAPGAAEAIKYGMPTFVLFGKNLVHFAAFKNHIGFYPGPSAITAYKKQLRGYKTSKGAIQFPLNEPLRLGLVKAITQYRVTEVRLLLHEAGTVKKKNA